MNNLPFCLAFFSRHMVIRRDWDAIRAVHLDEWPDVLAEAQTDFGWVEQSVTWVEATVDEALHVLPHSIPGGVRVRLAV